jgi:hypothetical protein
MAPSAGPNVPGKQGVQLLPFVPQKPATHVQAVLPTSDVELGPQVAHSDAPASMVRVPAGQGSQSAASLSLLKLPGAHGMQTAVSLREVPSQAPLR